MKLIYIAGPYRAKTKARRDLHIEQAKLTAVLLLEKGWFPVSPILNTARFEEYCPWVDDQVFLNGTLDLMSRCDAVCLLPGYEFSEGTAGEIAEARRIGMKVYKAEIDVPAPDQHVPAIPPESVAIPRMPEDLQESKE